MSDVPGQYRLVVQHIVDECVIGFVAIALRLQHGAREIGGRRVSRGGRAIGPQLQPERFWRGQARGCPVGANIACTIGG